MALTKASLFSRIPRSRSGGSLDVFLCSRRFMLTYGCSRGRQRPSGEAGGVRTFDGPRACLPALAPLSRPRLCSAEPFREEQRRSCAIELPVGEGMISSAHRSATCAVPCCGRPGSRSSRVPWSTGTPWRNVTLRRRRFVPCTVEAERITDHEVMRVHAIYLPDHCVADLHLHHRHRSK